ncbi:LLM class flavin-dependent oxidoreductase [Actinacidiphila oryziradicis]|uniref:LLM class flavin-dependent oxidoreductase n=1 Tax=Actinacidiphila oryziradicis TaxID=2571141 RepID=UPI0023F4AD02|nr:LLM class flavin-dependent oxidoreductase [Actinacidiphila oryziradicis]MCW2874826.1 luciferase family protein [Actinacidiphila oryziradicis]
MITQEQDRSGPGPFGLMHQMWAPADQSDSAFFRTTLEDVVLADQLGYDSVWIAEHHYVRGKAFYARLPHIEIFIARLISETSRIRLATGIKLLILDDPEHIAEKVRLLNLLSDGRVILGLGQGSPDELGVRDLTSDEKRLMFRTRLEELVGYLDGGLAANGLALTPDYPIKIAETVWVGVRDDVSVAQAARLGTNFIVGEAELGARQAPYITNYRGAGGVGEARGARLVCVGETYERALADVRVPAHQLNDAFSKGKYQKEMVELGMMSADAALDEHEILGRLEYAVGAPDDVTEQLYDYITTTGVNALNIMVHAPGISQESAQRSLQLFMSEVAPALVSALAKNDP